MNYSKGICWIDDCRIPFSINDDERIGKGYFWNSKAEPFGDAKTLLYKEGWDTKGRFPANLLVSDDMLNDGNITKVQDKLKDTTKQYKGGNFGGGSVSNNFYFGDKGTNSRYYDIDKWFDKMINEL